MTATASPATTQNSGVVTYEVAMPEFLSRDDSESESWEVVAGAPVRGDAWTNRTDRRMKVPFGNDDVARVIRAHEMAHAKVSPMTMDQAVAACGNVPADIVVACEEIRVNEVVRIAGFDLDLLSDGSERKMGQRLAAMGAPAWDQIVRMVAGTAGTKACTAMIAGMRTVDPEIANAASVVNKAITKQIKKWQKRYGRRYADNISSTIPHAEHLDVPSGFDFTIEMAHLVNGFLVSESEGEPVDMPRIKRATESNGSRGKFAPLILDEIPLDLHVDGQIGRKRIPSQTGRRPRHMARLLTDPERRVFDRRSRGKGGVVLIDQSGSMELSHSDIEAMIEAAPGCVIIGYSHIPGSHGVPNAWVIAKRGKVASEFPDGGNGNGVDGPALHFALSLRRTGEPLIWICDGMVTDGANDQWYHNLGVDCATTVMRKGVHMVENVEMCLDALKKSANGQRLEARLTGSLWNCYEANGNDDEEVLA